MEENMSQSDDPGPGSTPPGWDQPSYPEPPHGQPAYGTPAPYGQPSYGQPPYAGQYGQGQYGQPAYGAPAPYGQYGYPGVPGRPGGVTTAAVVGLVFAAFGVVATLLVLLGGAALVGLAGALGSATGDPFAGELAGDAATGVGVGIVVVGLVCLLWTVLMVWGSVWVLTGRSRVLLLVGGSVSAVVTFLGLLISLFDTGGEFGTAPGYLFGIVVSLLFFVGALAIVVPLCLSSAAQYFAAHRARRGG
jgi:hypothetical protein